MIFPISSTMKRLDGKIAIVTASTDGIGLAIAERLAKEGAQVIISSRRKNNVKESTNKLIAQGLDVRGLVCHVAKSEDRARLFEEARKLGGLDILVSNAAVSPEVAAVLDTTETSWDKIFEINLKASYLLAKEALPLLRKSKAGRIIFISSITGLQPNEHLGAYSVSKTALLGLTKAAALQLAPDNVTVNCVVPGLIRTKFSGSITSDESTLSTIPLKRPGEPNEITGIVAYLASEESSYVTGENFVIAGGMLSRL
ncbi:unnamed protein product [Phaedon cochleariae]|uniref:Uncharacterized protein n=1 Tax=Phaedon cochleariae TaxID=80249 RepID=A0A9N9X0B1_PHACE|nr:unnamed protein product [Phaedon cochleariae]